MNTSDISWFSLSEAIRRKEREKAFFSLKLLSYSIKNKNFRQQILADLYFSFEEYDVANILYKEVFENYFFEKDYNGLLMIINRLNFFENKIDIKHFIEKIDSLNDEFFVKHKFIFKEPIDQNFYLL